MMSARARLRSAVLVACVGVVAAGAPQASAVSDGRGWHPTGKWTGHLTDVGFVQLPTRLTLWRTASGTLTGRSMRTYEPYTCVARLRLVHGDPSAQRYRLVEQLVKNPGGVCEPHRVIRMARAPHHRLHVALVADGDVIAHGRLHRP